MMMILVCEYAFLKEKKHTANINIQQKRQILMDEMIFSCVAIECAFFQFLFTQFSSYIPPIQSLSRSLTVYMPIYVYLSILHFFFCILCTTLLMAFSFILSFSLSFFFACFLKFLTHFLRTHTIAIANVYFFFLSWARTCFSRHYCLLTISPFLPLFVRIQLKCDNVPEGQENIEGIKTK